LNFASFASNDLSRRNGLIPVFNVWKTRKASQLCKHLFEQNFFVFPYFHNLPKEFSTLENFGGKCLFETKLSQSSKVPWNCE